MKKTTEQKIITLKNKIEFRHDDIWIAEQLILSLLANKPFDLDVEVEDGTVAWVRKDLLAEFNGRLMKYREEFCKVEKKLNRLENKGGQN